MAIVIKPITVEVSKPNLFQAIAAKQNDSNSRFLNVTFVNEGEKITVLPTSKTTINAKRRDGESESFYGEVNEDGTVTVPIHSWILELDGYVDCDVSIIDAESRKLTSTTFSLLVEAASNGDEDISEDPQMSVLEELIEEVKAIEEGMINGATFTPSVSEDGTLSWTNDQNLENPVPVNIKGGKGDTGTSITIIDTQTSTQDGGANKVTFSDGAILTVLNGSKGSKGDKGDTPVFSTETWTFTYVDGTTETKVVPLV